MSSIARLACRCRRESRTCQAAGRSAGFALAAPVLLQSYRWALSSRTSVVLKTAQSMAQIFVSPDFIIMPIGRICSDCCLGVSGQTAEALPRNVMNCHRRGKVFPLDLNGNAVAVG